MKRTMILAALVLFLIPTALFAADIEGVYNCTGSNPNGGSYTGTVSIAKNGASYNVTWNIGSQVYLGVGLLEGEQFSVGYTDTNKSWFGVVVYKVSDKTLKGPWAMHDGAKNGTETLIKR